MNLPTRLPIFPLGNVLFPGAHMPLHIFEARYRELMRDHTHDDPIFGVVLTETGHEVGDEPTIHTIGTGARLLAASEFSDGRWAIVVEGIQRFHVSESTWDQPYLVASVEWLNDVSDEPPAPHAVDRLIDAFTAYLRAVGAQLADSASIDSIKISLRTAFANDLDGLTYLIATQLPLNTWHRQRVLELPTLSERSREVRSLIRQEQAILKRAGATTWHASDPSASIVPN